MLRLYAACLGLLMASLPCAAQVNYWFDNNKEESGVITTATAELDVSKLSLGMHVLHVQDISVDTLPSTIHSRWFVRTQGDAKDIETRYWFNNGKDIAGHLTEGANVIDVSALPYGLHTVHIQGLGAEDQTTIHTRWFLRSVNLDGQLSCHYWFDNDKSTGGNVEGEMAEVDVSGLTDGLHTIHMQGEGQAGPSSIHTRWFVKEFRDYGDISPIYWFDNQRDKCDTLDAPITAIDVSGLTLGLHTIHLQGLSTTAPSSITSRWFVRTVETPGQIIHHYWFDNDRQTSKAVTGGLSEVDVKALPIGLHTLHLQGIDKDNPSVPYSRHFFKVPMTDATQYVCATWIDSTYYRTDKIACEGGKLRFNLDVSGLEDGEHELWVVLTAEDGSTPQRLSSLFVKASLTLSIHVDEPGTLRQLVLDEVASLTDVRTLRITGRIDETDMAAMREEMDNMTELDMGDLSLSTVPDGMMRGHSKIASITLPELLTMVGQDAFADCPELLTLVSRSAGVPLGDHDLLGDGREAQARLYVPAVTMRDYQEAANWQKFGTIEPITSYDPSVYHLLRDAHTYDDYAIANQPSIFIHEGGSLAMGSKKMRAKDFSMAVDIDSLDYSPLVATGSMTAETVSLTLALPAGKWSFVCLPFDVKIADITHADSVTRHAIRYYDGASRAQNGIVEGMSNWKNFGSDDIIPAGQGFILHHDAASGTERFTFTACGNENSIFASGDVTAQLTEHAGNNVKRQHRSWNLVGNPYPAYYDMSHCDFTSPVTVWNGDGYDAYSVAEDELVLQPFQAFFVQRPADSGSMTFEVSGRDATMRKAKGVRDAAAGRETINLCIGRARTRVVVNETASLDYELACDAAKFFGGSCELYTIEQGVAMAINERPAGDGIVQLGYSCKAGGEYTITSDREVTLIDKLLNTEAELGYEGYTFTTGAGRNDKRFELRLHTASDGVGQPAGSHDTDCYTISGIRMPGTPKAKGIYIRGGRKVVIGKGR